MTRNNITSELLADLKAKAEKATPGPWCVWLVKDSSVFGATCFVRSHADPDEEWVARNVETRANGEYIAAANPDVALALIRELERLHRIVDFQTRAMADCKQVAKIAWGGEVQSPYPDHNSSEEDMAEQAIWLDYPLCGGSGYVGDCDDAAQELKCHLEKCRKDNDRLEKEAQWLAKHCEGEEQCPYLSLQWGETHAPKWCNALDTIEDGFECFEDPVDCWRKVAREAVAEQKD